MGAFRLWLRVFCDDFFILRDGGFPGLEALAGSFLFDESNVFVDFVGIGLGLEAGALREKVRKAIRERNGGLKALGGVKFQRYPRTPVLTPSPGGQTIRGEKELDIR
jgi:hypothetical protein